MTNDEKNQPTKEPHPRDITRRDFATILVGAGIAAGVSSTAAAEVGMEMVETDVEIKTPDGTCDAAFIYPTAIVSMMRPGRDCAKLSARNL